MEEKEATYQYQEEAHGNGMFFYTSCCGNKMYSVDSNVHSPDEDITATRIDTIMSFVIVKKLLMIRSSYRYLV
jgi:hypothetical protein